MWQRLLAISYNTFLETIRQPVYGVILLLTALLLILNVGVAAFTLDNDDLLLLDLGLATLMLSGLFLSAFSATGVLTREIENRTVLSVVSKPVSRPLFLLGKYFGLIAALTLASYLSTLVFILCQRHGVLQNSSDPWDGPVLAFGFGSLFLALIAAAFCNFFYRKHFATGMLAFMTPFLTISVICVAKLDEQFDVIPFLSNFVGGQIIMAAFLVYLIVVLTAGVAIAASTRFGQMMTLIICTGFVAVGLSADYAFGQHADTSSVANFLYHVVPNIGPFWVIDGLFAETATTTITPTYVQYMTLYTVLWTIVLLSLGIISFQRREVG